MIRISAGRFRGRKLILPKPKGEGARLRHGKAPESIRPSSTRVREAVFDILGARAEVEGARFLDLYAGTGAVGIEALSRGAAHVTFVENFPVALAALQANLAALGVEEETEVIPLPVARAPIPTGGFDLAFADPPFRKNLLAEAMEALARAVRPGGWAILQAARDEAPPAHPVLTSVKEYRHGETTLYLFSIGS